MVSTNDTPSKDVTFRRKGPWCTCEYGGRGQSVESGV
jgi:hypothetical protein